MIPRFSWSRWPRAAPNVVITRVWQPTDGPDALADLVRAVRASGGTLIARIPAVVLAPNDLVAEDTRIAPSVAPARGSCSK